MKPNLYPSYTLVHINGSSDNYIPNNTVFTHDAELHTYRGNKKFYNDNDDGIIIFLGYFDIERILNGELFADKYKLIENHSVDTIIEF